VALALEKLDAFVQADAGLLFDGVFRDSKPGGDFALRQAIDLPKRQDLTAAFRQGFDGFDQDLHLFGSDGGFIPTSRFFPDT
jgi:hypothetical protein